MVSAEKSNCKILRILFHQCNFHLITLPCSKLPVSEKNIQKSGGEGRVLFRCYLAALLDKSTILVVPIRVQFTCVTFLTYFLCVCIKRQHSVA